jgi:TIR domain
MRGGPRPKVFISHSTSGDAGAAALVVRLRERLQEWGVDPWLDLDRLQAGELWNDTIRLAIERCDAAILVVTDRYLRPGAHYARDEALLFAQRAATEAFDDFRLLVLLAPGITPDRLATDRDWSNLEIHRRQIKQLDSLAPEQADLLRPNIETLLERYRSGSVPLVLREYYADQIARSAWSAVLAQAAAELDLALLVDGAVTPRRFVNIMLGVPAEVRRTLDIIERCLHAWRGVLADELRRSLGWDSIAFSWLDDDTAEKVASVTRTIGTPGRGMLVLITGEGDTVRLHLRRAREVFAPFDDTGPNPGQITREGVIRAICDEIKARRARRERRDPLTIPEAELEGLAADLNERVGSTNPLVAVLGRDLCSEDLLRGLPDLFSNLILVAMADESQAGGLAPTTVVLRPQQEDKVLEYLDKVLA